MNHYSTGIIPLRHSLMYALLKNGHEVIGGKFLPLSVIRSLERERRRKKWRDFEVFLVNVKQSRRAYCQKVQVFI